MYQERGSGSGKDGNHGSAGTWGLRLGACNLPFLADMKAVQTLIDGHDGCGVVRTWMQAMRVYMESCYPSWFGHLLPIVPVPQFPHSAALAQPPLARPGTRTMLTTRLFVGETCPSPA